MLEKRLLRRLESEEAEAKPLKMLDSMFSPWTPARLNS